MASHQLIKTILDKQISFHLIRVAKIQRSTFPKNINISYTKYHVVTRYNMQCDGSFLSQKDIDTYIKGCDISYKTETELFQDIEFLKSWSINIEHDLYYEDNDLVRLIC